MDGYHYLLSVLWCLLLLKCDILYQHFACYIQCAFYCFQLLEWVQERVLGLGDSITTLLTLMAMGEVIFWVTWWHHETTTNDDEIKWTTLLSSVIIGGWCWSLAGDWWCINTGVMKALDRVGDAIDCAGLGWAGQGWAGLGWDAEEWIIFLKSNLHPWFMSCLYTKFAPFSLEKVETASIFTSFIHWIGRYW